MVAMKPGEGAIPLSSLLDYCGVEFDDVAVSGVALDSRKVSEGDVFLAMPGEVHDGRQFIEQAVANGAAAVIAQGRSG